MYIPLEMAIPFGFRADLTFSQESGVENNSEGTRKASDKNEI